MVPVMMDEIGDISRNSISAQHRYRWLHIEIAIERYLCGLVYTYIFPCSVRNLHTFSRIDQIWRHKISLKE